MQLVFQDGYRHEMWVCAPYNSNDDAALVVGMQFRFTIYIFDIGHPCYGQLTPVNKVSADQYHMTISQAQV